MELKKSKRKDYYKTLGLQKNCGGEDEIKKAYKKHALLHHPGMYHTQLVLIIWNRFSSLIFYISFFYSYAHGPFREKGDKMLTLKKVFHYEVLHTI